MFIEIDSANYDPETQDFTAIANGKLVVFGIPKCGNTWMQSLLCKYFDVDPVLTENEIDNQGVFSTHLPYEPWMGEREDFVSGICLTRDIRDVICSYYHYANTDQWHEAMTRNWYEDFDSFYYEWFLSRCVPSHRMYDFNTEFAERGLPVVRYERLQAAPLYEFSRLIKRLGFQVDEEKLKECVSAHELSKLKKTGLTVRHHVASSHFRKGGWGNFLDEMPSHILEDVNVRFGDFLRRWGYPVDLSEQSIERYRKTLDL